MKRILPLCCAVFLLTGLVQLAAEETARPASSEEKVPVFNRFFPAAYFVRSENPDSVDQGSISTASSLPYSVPDQEQMENAYKENYLQNLLLNNQILAFYGSPVSKQMGILGRMSLPDLCGMLDQYAQVYDKANGDRGIVKAFYIIYGTAWPGGDIGYLRESKLMPYIEYAQAHNMLVFIDHQIGRFSVKEAMEKILPYLRYDCVQLALDPEWHTDKPMQEIGSIEADDLNLAQKMMQDYMVRNGIPGRRILVVHQFNFKMIAHREKVRADFDKVILIHNADGFGNPQVKLGSYQYNNLACNMPLKGFKLFLKTDVVGAGYDVPLISPEDVLKLDPEPEVIMYQ
jgi:hypothetical protein